MKLRIYDVLLSVFVGGAVGLSGCGKSESTGPLVPVRGKVTLGTKPLVGGSITLIPLAEESNGPRPEAEIDTGGLYSLKTGGREGAPVGKYRATLTTSGLDKTQDTAFNSVYSHWENSPLVIAVTEHAPPGTYDLTLKPR